MDEFRSAAQRILEGIEEGKLSAADSQTVVEEADPALVYLLFTWLRKHYKDHPNADAVIGRFVDVSNRGQIAKQMNEGKADPVSRWFEEGYSYKDYNAQEFIDLVVDKLES